MLPVTLGTIAVRRLRRALVAVQFAIATRLLIGAGLPLASLNQLKDVDIGFDQRHVIIGRVRLPAAQYQDPGMSRVFWDRLTRRMATVPGVAGVAGVAFADSLPPTRPCGSHSRPSTETTRSVAK